MDWRQYFMTMVYLVAMKSKDPSTKIGAVIVGEDMEIRSTGYNGFPRNVTDNETTYPERHERPEKYYWYEHAERNAIYNAARMGLSLKNCVIYTQKVPCADCARGIIQSGIKEVIYDSDRDSQMSEKWEDSAERSRIMFHETGVRLSPIIIKIEQIKGLFDGKEIKFDD